MTELEIIFEVIKTGAILIGGLVALYEYRRFRRFGYKAQLDLDFDIIPLGDKVGDYLLDIEPRIKNLGAVRQYFPMIQIWAKTLKKDDISTGYGNGLIRFSEKLLVPTNIVHDPTDPYFVDPNVEQLFSQQLIISKPEKLIMVTVRFFYRVSLIRYLYLRFICFFGLSKKWKNPNKLDRLRKYHVHEYHVTSKIKQIKDSL